jgi:hypothetical protein
VCSCSFRFHSFNVLLSDPSTAFSGGGTYFDHPLNYSKQPVGIGGALVHCGKRRHAGNAITSGTRYLLVGFVDEQRTGTCEGRGLDGAPGGGGRGDVATEASVSAAANAEAAIELHFQDHS